MSEFKIIETQEQFEEVIKGRIEQAKRAARKEFDGFLSPEEVAEKYKGYLSAEDAEKKYKDYKSPEEVAQLNAKIKGYEVDSVKNRIAHECGLDYGAIQYLKGDDEESIKKSAEGLKNLIGATYTIPLANHDYTVGGDDSTEGLKNTLRGLKGE